MLAIKGKRNHIKSHKLTGFPTFSLSPELHCVNTSCIYDSVSLQIELQHGYPTKFSELIPKKRVTDACRQPSATMFGAQCQGEKKEVDLDVAGSRPSQTHHSAA